ncbi:hypothetical protein J2125_001909 [Erwinia toletana]|uniref:Lipoprotein n=1 Tax=Winslowiella toletana TaxID=92490 RepID=A0ABS4P7V0_9GAMM|nr:hypothetical protein [Winslowiella toletana]MBP2168717.1 hypothetical protein [Winslowiella toletana]
MKRSIKPLCMVAAFTVITMGICAPAFACYRQRSDCYYNCMRFHNWQWWQRMACALGGRQQSPFAG